MGWASGSCAFSPIGKALRGADVAPGVKTEIAVAVIRAFQDMDWDTEDESLEEFADDPGIVAAFRQACPYMFED